MTGVIIWASTLLPVGAAIGVRLRRETGLWIMFLAVYSVGLGWLYSLLPE